MRAARSSMLDVDDQPRRPVVGEGQDPDAGLRREAEVPGALRLEVAALDEVDEGRVAGLELRRSVIAGRALQRLLRATAQDQAQEALALDLDRQAGRVLRERGLGTLEARLRQAI